MDCSCNSNGLLNSRYLSPEANAPAQMSIAGTGMAPGAAAFLINPFEAPMQVVLSSTIAAASPITQFFLGDACGLAEVLSLVGGANSQELQATNGITRTQIKEFLKTHALIIGGYNFETTRPELLSNNLKVIYSNIDTNSKSKNLFSAQDVSNMQFNGNLLNITQPFVWTNQAAFRIPVVSDAVNATTYTFTFKVLAAIPYGLLDQYLKAAKIVERSKLNC